MNVRCNYRCVFQSGILACLLLAPACAAADVDIIFASDFLSGSALQWVRRNPQAGGATIALAPALVSAVKSLNGANMTLYLQVPPGLNNEGGYPFFSAVKTFGPSNASLPANGDCVIAQGTITVFHGATELSLATITATAGTDCGGSPLVPYATTVADIATDTDPVADNQPGPSAEALESVLVTLNPVDGKPGLPGEGFSVWDTGIFSNSFLYVAPTLYAFSAGTPGTVQTFHITGVFDESDPTVPPPTNQYQLLPRSADDIVVLP
jgi:hypothetical protein